MKIDPAIWTEKLKPFEVELQASHKHWTWTTGGCFAFASAFQAAFGGEFYGVCRIWEEDGNIDYPVDHALVLLDGVYYDHDGEFEVSKIGFTQVIKHKDDDLVCWFEDEFFDDAGWTSIHEIMVDCARDLAPGRSL